MKCIRNYINGFVQTHGNVVDKYNWFNRIINIACWYIILYGYFYQVPLFSMSGVFFPKPTTEIMVVIGYIFTAFLFVLMPFVIILISLALGWLITYTIERTYAVFIWIITGRDYETNFGYALRHDERFYPIVITFRFYEIVWVVLHEIAQTIAAPYKRHLEVRAWLFANIEK